MPSLSCVQLHLEMKWEISITMVCLKSDKTINFPSLKVKSVFKPSSPFSCRLSWFPQYEATRITTPPKWDACPLQGYPSTFYQIFLKICWYPFIFLGKERHCGSKVLSTRTQNADLVRSQTWTFYSSVQLISH